MRARRAGWSIANLALERPYGGSAWEVSNPQNADTVSALAIHGYVKGATVPGAPSITGISAAPATAGSLGVTWTAPTDNGGSGLTGYDLRYYAGASDPTDAADWVEEGESNGLPDPAGTATSATITGLKANTRYQVQVRAANVVGKGPWSASHAHTTATSDNTSNNAPVALTSVGNTCPVDTATTPSYGPHTSAAGTAVSVVLTETPVAATSPTSCASQPPIFHDADGETLSLSLAATLPANVTLATSSLRQTPQIAHLATTGDTRLWSGAVAAGGDTDMTATVTATDPHGASRTITYTFRVGTFTGTSAPRFDEAVGVLRFAQNEAGSAVLPPATGGDTRIGTTVIPNPYIYRVTGLPPGFTFDAATRTVSKPRSAATAGTWTVTYTADDFDADYSQATGTKNGQTRPTAADLADAATQTFSIVVAAAGAQPTIDLVRVVSAPTHDSGGDGKFDTYVLRDRILVDVEMSEPVVVSGSHDHVKLRLHVGNTHKVARLDSILHGGQTLRFGYSVAASDRDTDGIWVQTIGSDTVVALAGASDPTITSAATGVDADLTKTGLPTAGGELEGTERSNVDGSKGSADRGPVPETATIDGATLRVDFTEALNPSLNTGQLLYYLAVHGAGDVSGGHRNADQHPDRIWLDNDDKTLVLTVMNPARAGQKVRLTYSSRTLLKAGRGQGHAPEDPLGAAVPRPGGDQQHDGAAVGGGAAARVGAGQHPEADVRPGDGRGLRAAGERLPGAHAGRGRRHEGHRRQFGADRRRHGHRDAGRGGALRRGGARVLHLAGLEPAAGRGPPDRGAVLRPLPGRDGGGRHAADADGRCRHRSPGG